MTSHLPVRRHLLHKILDMVLPPRCPCCGEMVNDDAQFCSTCWQDIRFITAPQCDSCGRPLPLLSGQGANSKAAICLPCMQDPPIHDGIIAMTVYDEVSRRLVLDLKYGGKIGLANFIARLLAQKIPEHARNHPDYLLMAVPLHRKRLWQRGFNQSILIASALSRLTGIALRRHDLIRVKSTPKLKNMGHKERHDLLKNAFRLAPKLEKHVKGKHIYLVDDIYTSGATSNGCIRPLKKPEPKA